MIRLSITPPEPGADPIARLAQRLPAILRASLEGALADGLAVSQARMGAGGPAIRSGRLARSLGWRVTGGGDVLEGELYAEAPYAGVQEEGAVILARRAKYLKFRVAGRWVQVKRVVIPARPFLRPGGEAAVAALEAHLARALMEEMS
ncbi:MAG: HK97 gp10 family phage protein [Pseudomonadota bacterium]